MRLWSRYGAHPRYSSATPNTLPFPLSAGLIYYQHNFSSRIYHTTILYILPSSPICRFTQCFSPPSRLRICYLGTNTSLATLAKNLNSLRMLYVEKGFSITQWLNTQKYAKGFAHSQAEIRIFTMNLSSSADEPFCS